MENISKILAHKPNKKKKTRKTHDGKSNEKKKYKSKHFNLQSLSLFSFVFCCYQTEKIIHWLLLLLLLLLYPPAAVDDDGSDVMLYVKKVAITT